MQRIFFTLIVLISFSLSGCAFTEAEKKQAAYHYQMGLSYLGENNPTGALIELTEAEKVNPDDPELLNYLGMAYFRKARYDIAEKKYLSALSVKPTYSEARNNLGVNYLEMKRWDDAIYQLKQVTEDIFYKDQLTANINLGLAYYGKGDLKKALSIFRSMLTPSSNDPRVHLHLGKVYESLDKNDLAIEEYKRATQLFKDYANAYYSLGLAHLKKHQKNEAQGAFQEVVRIAPNSEIGQLAREYLQTLE